MDTQVSPKLPPIRLLPSFAGPGNRGSREHFFHFMLGYLLPGLEWWTRRAPDRAGRILTCGPLMDERILELSSLMGLEVRIEPGWPALDATKPGEVFHCPRWDLWLMTRQLNKFRLWLASRRSGSVLSGMRRIQALILKNCGLGALSNHPPKPEWLLLDRSEEHDFYRQGGDAEISSYGKGRRAIANLVELELELKKAGIQVKIYEPGANPIQHQIKTFHEAHGIIGVRGAEFANLLWMRPGSRALMIATPTPRKNQATRNLALLQGISFQSLAVDTKYPVVSGQDIIQMLQASSRR